MLKAHCWGVLPLLMLMLLLVLEPHDQATTMAGPKHWDQRRRPAPSRPRSANAVWLGTRPPAEGISVPTARPGATRAQVQCP